MKKIIAALLCISSFCFSYTEDFDNSMKLFWKLYNSGEIEQADNYLTSLIQNESTQNSDRIHYLMYKNTLYYKLGEHEKYAENRKILQALLDSDPALLLEVQENWIDCVYPDDGD